MLCRIADCCVCSNVMGVLCEVLIKIKKINKGFFLFNGTCVIRRGVTVSYSYCVSMMIDVCSDNSFIHAVQVNFS